MTRPAAAQDSATQSTGLAIGAMTCASSAARAESKLNRLGSVTAAVNLATGKALVSFPGGITPGEPITAVDQAGGEADEAAVLRPRPLVSLLTAVPVVVPKMVPGLQITGWQWLSLALGEQTQPFPAGRSTAWPPATLPPRCHRLGSGQNPARSAARSTPW